MLVASIPKPEFIKSDADVIELRLDCFPSIDKKQIEELCSRYNCPIIFTFRRSPFLTEVERLAHLKNLLSLKPAFCDLEHDTDPNFLKELSKETKLIISYHDFEKTADDLNALFSEIQSPYAYAYKIAATAKSTSDALRMLLFVRKNQERRIAGISMGKEGEITRILAPVFGGFFSFGSTDLGITASGQISVRQLHKIYRYRDLNRSTDLYGLIGDPVDSSISQITHNKMIEQQGLDAVYVKMCVKAEELPIFIPLAIDCGFKGLSVTMPLKEKIVSFVDHLDPFAKRVRSVNTLHFENGIINGFNTDGPAALDAIEKKIGIEGKKIVILGAGGAARSIAYEAHGRGAFINILNRTESRAHQLAKEIGCFGGSLGLLPKEYDVVVNAIPCQLDLGFLPNIFFLDIKTRSIEAPIIRGIQPIHGYIMFALQALAQFKIWFKISVDQIYFENLCLKTLGKKEPLADHQ